MQDLLTIENIAKDYNGINVINDISISVKDNNWIVSLNTYSNTADLDDVFYFWPEKHKPKVRKWVADHFEHSKLFDISMQTELENGLAPKLSWSFAFSETSFAPLKAFPLIEQAAGHFVSRDYATTVFLEEGVIFDDKSKAIDISGSSFFIKDSRIKPSPAQIKRSLKEYSQADKILIPSNYSINSFLKMGFSKEKILKVKML